MAPNSTARHTTKLIQLKEKMATLRQEEEKICQTLAQDLAQCLINAQALEIDFDTLIGGILEVVNQAQANGNNPTPEQSQKLEVWKKSGQKFRRRVSGSRGQNEQNRGDEKQERQEKQQADKQGFYQPKQSLQQRHSPAVPKQQKDTEKVT